MTFLDKSYTIHYYFQQWKYILNRDDLKKYILEKITFSIKYSYKISSKLEIWVLTKETH